MEREIEKEREREKGAAVLGNGTYNNLQIFNVLN